MTEQRIQAQCVAIQIKVNVSYVDIQMLRCSSVKFKILMTRQYQVNFVLYLTAVETAVHHFLHQAFFLNVHLVQS